MKKRFDIFGKLETKLQRPPRREYKPKTRLGKKIMGWVRGRSELDKPHRQNKLAHAVNEWFSRLLGVVSDRSFDVEERYGTHRTKRDYLWNSIGMGCWGFVFPFLTIVITWRSGAEQAGIFALAFVTAKLLMFMGNFGMRTYQVSDLDEKHSFGDYQVTRVITCIAMLLAGFVYSAFHGYTGDIAVVFVGMYFYKMIDAFGDVYEGRLQQKDKMYLAGVSLAVRSVFASVGFTITILITGAMGASCIVMAIVAAATLVLFTIPLAWMETPTGGKISFASVRKLFVRCAPLFVALFLYNLVDNMPKFVMEGVLSYDNQLYFNVLYFPAQLIMLCVELIYRPLLVKLAETWSRRDQRRRFDLTIVAMMAIIIVLTVVVILVMDWFGLKLFSIIYGLDFMQFRSLSRIMLVAGGVCSAIDFLYQVITILRRQKGVMKLYLITFGFSLFIPMLLIDFTGLTGAVMSYLIVMSILFGLLIVEYVTMRLGIVREERDALEDEVAARAERRAETGAGAGAGAGAGVGSAAGNQMVRRERANVERKGYGAANDGALTREEHVEKIRRARRDGQHGQGSQGGKHSARRK